MRGPRVLRSWLLMALLAAASCAVSAQTAEALAVQEAPPEAAVAAIEAAHAVKAPRADDVPGGLREVGRGIASWYGGQFHGRRTASGERFDMHALTAAHPTLPFGTVVRVQSLVNGQEVEVRINDRGPHVKQRVIDLSRAAAQALGLLQSGTGTKPVLLSVLQGGEQAAAVRQPPQGIRKRPRR
ncbi:MAG: septal ring lytic transglycosylase RlpA family protein [Haliea sp.]|nr:MAG: septal ring lytic transglycosylase RlpA family protein [Haliea sp.]